MFQKSSYKNRSIIIIIIIIIIITLGAYKNPLKLLLYSMMNLNTIFLPW
jgi:hypothetical protein